MVDEVPTTPERILKAAREKAGISLAAMAARTGYSYSYVANLERGVKPVRPHHIAAYERVMNEGEPGDMKRRTAILGALASMSGPGSNVLSEALRLSMMDQFGVADSWHDVTAEIGKEYLTSPAANIHDAIGAYLLVLSDQKDSPETRDAAARLMLLRAMTTANLGHYGEASGWYRSARRIASTSGNDQLVTLVWGREATRRCYESSDPSTVIEFTAKLDCTEGYLARAQAFARLGERSRAVSALADAARVYDRTNQSEDSAYGFQPWRYSLTEAYVWALLGDLKATESLASSTQLPASLLRFRAQRDLTLAVAVSRSGDIPGGRAMAQAVIASHPADQYPTILRSMLKEASL